MKFIILSFILLFSSCSAITENVDMAGDIVNGTLNPDNGNGETPDNGNGEDTNPDNGNGEDTNPDTSLDGNLPTPEITPNSDVYRHTSGDYISFTLNPGSTWEGTFVEVRDGVQTHGAYRAITIFNGGKPQLSLSYKAAPNQTGVSLFSPTQSQMRGYEQFYILAPSTGDQYAYLVKFQYGQYTVIRDSIEYSSPFGWYYIHGQYGKDVPFPVYDENERIYTLNGSAVKSIYTSASGSQFALAFNSSQTGAYIKGNKSGTFTLLSATARVSITHRYTYSSSVLSHHSLNSFTHILSFYGTDGSEEHYFAKDNGSNWESMILLPATDIEVAYRPNTTTTSYKYKYLVSSFDFQLDTRKAQSYSK